MVVATRIAATLTAICCGFVVEVASAQSPAPPSAWSNPIIVHTRTAASEPAASQLLELARRKGTIRVILGLNLSLRNEDTLAANEEDAQRRALAAIQLRVAQRSLPGVAADRIVRFEHIPFMSAWVDADQLRRLLLDPEVMTIQEDRPVPANLLGSVPRIQAADLWAQGITGAGTLVAVLDTGVTRRHDMFVGKIAEEACFSTNGTNIASLCPGGVTEKIGRGAGQNCSLEIAGCDHGTHVASIAAGDAESISGVAFDARLIIVQVFSKQLDPSLCSPLLAPCITSFPTDQIKGLEQVFKWRRRYTIAAANLSLGGGAFTGACDDENPAMTAIIQKLRNSAIATVISAGNEGLNGQIDSPACISQAVAVGSSTKRDLISDFSNHGPMVKVLAPGSAITAARAGTANRYTVMSGTSQAAPHVAGAFALLRQAKPAATVSEIVRAMICTGKPLKRDEYQLRKPRILLQDALNYLLSPPSEPRIWNFSSSADEEDWPAQLGAFRVVSGNLRLTSINPDPISWWNVSWFDTCNGNVTVEARMRRIDENANEELYGDSGVFINADLDAETLRVSGYWVGYNSYTVCDICESKGQAVIWRLDDYGLRDASGSATLLCAKQNAGVAIGGYNKIRAIVRDGVIRLVLNGNIVCTANDASYASGAVGLGTVIPIPISGAQSFRVDSVALTPPAPAVASDVEASAAGRVRDLAARYVGVAVRP